MFGWYEAARPDAEPALKFLAWNLRGKLPALSDDLRQWQLEEVNRRLKITLGNEKTPVYAQAWARAKEVTRFFRDRNDAQYAICMTAEFFRRHDANAAKVLADIDKEIDLEFGPSPVHPDIVELVRRLKIVAFLMPDAGRAMSIAWACTDVRAEVIKTHDLRQHPLPELAQLTMAAQSFHLDTRNYDEALKKILWTPMNRALCSSRPDAVAKTYADFQAIHKAHCASTFVTSLHAYCLQYFNSGQLTQPYIDAALRTGLSICAADRSASRKNWKLSDEEIICKALTQAFEDYGNELFRLTLDTEAAIKAEVDFGDRTGSNRAYLAAIEQRRQAADRAKLDALVARIVEPPEEQAQDSSWTQDLGLWALRQLPGPLTGPNSKPFDPRSWERRSQRPAQPQHEPDAAAGEAADDVADEAFAPEEAVSVKVGLAGLRCAAGFLADELRDTIALGKQLNANAKAVTDCGAAAQKLDELIRRIDAAGDCHDAQAVLTIAEAAIASLNGSIKIAQTNLKRQTQFDIQLHLALSTERRELYRRDGGKIACPLSLADWPWVYQKYHGRVLPQRFLMRGDRREPLEAHQALALYVTRTSDSGHAFNVSVHLWELIAGAAAPLELRQAPKPPFSLLDPNHWFDTRIPCLVLHVPNATA